MLFERQRRNGTEVHMARIHGICVEKNYQLPKGNPSRKFKGTRSLAGQPSEEPVSGRLPSSKTWAIRLLPLRPRDGQILYGCFPGHSVKLADAIQAYIQAVLTGPPCWVELPEDAWPDDVDFRKFRRPVVRLIKALYGHPDSGTMWGTTL